MSTGRRVPLPISATRVPPCPSPESLQSSGSSRPPISAFGVIGGRRSLGRLRALSLGCEAYVGARRWNYVRALRLVRSCRPARETAIPGAEVGARREVPGWRLHESAVDGFTYRALAAPVRGTAVAVTGASFVMVVTASAEEPQCDQKKGPAVGDRRATLGFTVQATRGHAPSQGCRPYRGASVPCPARSARGRRHRPAQNG